MKQNSIFMIYFYKGLIVISMLALILMFMEWRFSEEWTYFFYFFHILIIIHSLYGLRVISHRILISLTSLLLMLAFVIMMKFGSSEYKEPLTITLLLVMFYFIYDIWTYMQKMSKFENKNENKNH
ncbi:hypothetical protein [Thermococcus sp.]